jgi:predicted phosphatase
MEHLAKIQLVTEVLNILEIDGETMQHVIENTGMQDQMLRQLIMSAPIDQVQELITEKINLSKY